MPTQDTSNIKEKIMSTIRIKGPSLPVHISNATGQSMLFSSAFLSELLSEKKLKTSNMRVGTSPLYFISGQESQLERYAQEHLKSKEKDAFLLLKEKKFLKDSEQEPSIRVALRSIRDFAIPFKKGDEIYWKYLTASEDEFEEYKKNVEEKKEIKKHTIVEQPPQKFSSDLTKKIAEKSGKADFETNIKSASENEQKSKEKPLNIFDNPKEKPKKPLKKKTTKKKTKKQDDKFFNKVKEFLNQKGIRILDIQNFNKNDLTLKIKENGNEKLLVAFNKKRVAETDLTKAYKKSCEENLPYLVLSLGEPSKKIVDLIETIKKMEKIEVVE